MLILPLLAASAIAASPSPLAPAFKGTVVSTYPDGRTALLWLKADGSYTAKGRRRLPSSGQWTLRTGKVCLRQHKPSKVLVSVCTPFPAGAKLGTAWKTRAVTGEAIQVRIVDGRQVR